MKIDTNDIAIAIAASRFNEEITGGLVKLCRDELGRAGVRPTHVRTVWVPGAYELPFVAKRLAKTGNYDAVICFGCVIKGDTTHDVFVATWASVGLGQVSLETGVPVLFGVLTPKNEKQARARSRPGPLNRGKELAQSALEMIRLLRSKEI